MTKKIDIALSEILSEKNLLAKESLGPLIQEAEASGETLQRLLIKRNLLSEKEILNVLSEKLGLSRLDLKRAAIDKSVVDKIPVKIASYYGFMPVEIKDRMLTIAVSSPIDVKIQDEIRTQLGYDIETVLSLSGDILESLKRFYGAATETLQKIVSSAPHSEQAAQDTDQSQDRIEDIEKLAEDASVIKLVNQIIVEAWRKRATDIHIEPYRDRVSLRYRIDGLLYDGNAPHEIKHFLNAIISRIKIMSNLDIVERRLPQDGRAIVKVQDNVLDLRISTMPTPFGEGVVIRVLPNQMLFSMEKLGLSKKDMQIFESLIRKPHGIIFVTGPTGSGKTTTLYACLSRINTKELKIITIEDPIECEMQGITQIQVMPEIGLDFARGLRSSLRHDPDVMMVGEVRDVETAEIAIRVALTGHLVFSTLHTNDAASGVTRLIDIGVEPYLVASSVEAFIAQRLIRMVCPDCKQEDSAAPAELKKQIGNDLKINPSEVKLFRGKGCPNCNFTGFLGRAAIYEILLMDEMIKDLVVKKVPSSQIKKMAVSRGMRTLRQDGWQKVMAGLTTVEEVMKTASAEESRKDAEAKTDESVQVFYPDNIFEKMPEAEDLHLQGLDKRAFHRLNDKINLRYKAFKTQDELIKRDFKPEQFSVTKNLSAGGLLFVSNEALPVGSILELTIELPDGSQDIECFAKVVRVTEIEENKSYDIAVCFLDISGTHRTMLKKYVETTYKR